MNNQSPQIVLYRMLLLFGGSCLLALGVVIRLLPLDTQDPWLIRAGFILLCFLTYYLASKSSWAINNLSRIILVEVFLYVIWLIYLIAINRLDMFTSAITLFSVIGISMVFPDPRKLLLFLIIYFVLTAPVVLSIEEPLINPYIFLTLFISSSLLGYLILVFIDVMQKKLNRSNNDFKILVDSIQDAVFMVSKNYRLIKVNSKGTDILQKFFSRTINEGDNFLEFIFSEEQHGFKTNFDRALSGESVVVHSKLFSKEDEPTWFEFKFIPVLSGHGVNAVLFSAFDITTQRASAELLERSEKRFRTVFEAAPVGMAILLLDGKISEINSSFKHTLGYSVDNILNREFKDLVHLDNQEEYDSDISKLNLGEDEEFQGEMLLKRNDGSFIHSITRIARISNPGKNDFLLAQLVDISKLKESEARLLDKNVELEKANAELDRFVYSAAHDLRAPLTSVLGLINLVKNENGTELPKYLDLIEKSIIKLDHFIKDVIDYSRNSRSGLSIQKIDIKSLVEKTFEYHFFIEREANINHEVNVAGDEEFFNDPGRLEIVLNNLISNAIKYYDRKKKTPTITVNATTNKHGLDLEISDNGIGIPPENLDKIFNIFYRGHEQSKGSGLGLYIVKETIEKLNGVILVESHVDQGTLFKIKIPNLVLAEA